MATKGWLRLVLGIVIIMLSLLSTTTYGVVVSVHCVRIGNSTESVCTEKISVAGVIPIRKVQTLTAEDILAFCGDYWCEYTYDGLIKLTYKSPSSNAVINYFGTTANPELKLYFHNITVMMLGFAFIALPLIITGIFLASSAFPEEEPVQKIVQPINDDEESEEKNDS